MLRNKVVLAALMMAFTLSPAQAAKKPVKNGKANTSSSKKKTVGKKAVVATAATAAAVAAVAGENSYDRRMNTLSSQFLTALWRIDPEGAISAGKYDGAANLTIPDAAHRQAQLAFIDEWLDKFSKLDASKLSDKQRTDLALLTNKLQSDRWYLTTFRDFEWNPAQYNVASSIDFILNTEYASQPQRLRTLLKRIASVPQYYQAARASISQPTREHTQLAIAQSAGVLTVLDDLNKTAQASILSPTEKQLYNARIAAARTAVQGYAAWLTEQDALLAQNGARSFRIGKELYEQKFNYDIQAGVSAEQMYQKALAAREKLLENMDRLSDELWTKTMGNAAKPQDRNEKIGMVIDKLSSNHVAPADFVSEIRHQIPQLQEWVTSHDLLTMDPKKPLVVRETPPYQRGVAGASIEAPGPYRPQDRTYYNVTPLDGESPEQQESSLREYNHWILQILNIHEAIPGHYTQLVYANKSPSLIKSIFGNGAMIEGWAVYGERMMLESGYGNNEPEMWLMYSKWNLRSVTNTILDYSVHVLGMTQEQAIDLLTRQAFQTKREATEKWRRVQLSSVQLTSYFSGYSEIMDLREERKQALGNRFVLKNFHEQFLSYGSAPVKVIRELMQ
ncbi:DUF885 domain-containing protein [Janthinobacterium aquaticum]|uniref:DUF885 domain-containing protein n=1 Tax=Janthinobacterium sp. FT58W TaxID=2654254 RepID=UPI0012646F5C|nr:DUF885 domain-containing protein [Janthinobacterium sp. FT58W]KAB8041305.1 DUF885 family protein [Janthinobacterium sp. FT58W]